MITSILIATKNTGMAYCCEYSKLSPFLQGRIQQRIKKRSPLLVGGNSVAAGRPAQPAPVLYYFAAGLY